MILRPCRVNSALMSFPICGSSSIAFAFGGALRGGQKRWAEPSVCLLETEGSAKPVKRNKQQTIHALRREPFATYSLFTSNLPIISFRIRAQSSVLLYHYVIPIYNTFCFSLGTKVRKKHLKMHYRKNRHKKVLLSVDKRTFSHK